MGKHRTARRRQDYAELELCQMLETLVSGELGLARLRTAFRLPGCAPACRRQRCGSQIRWQARGKSGTSDILKKVPQKRERVWFERVVSGAESSAYPLLQRMGKDECSAKHSETLEDVLRADATPVIITLSGTDRVEQRYPAWEAMRSEEGRQSHMSAPCSQRFRVVAGRVSGFRQSPKRL